MARADDDTHEVYRTAQNTPSGSRSSREHDTSMIAIMDHEQRHSSDGDIQRVYYGHGALIVNLVLQVIIVCVLEGLQIQHTMTGMSKDCIMTLDVIEISQVGLVYRGLVVAATLYQLLFCLDTIQQQSGIHLAMLLVNGMYVPSPIFRMIDLTILLSTRSTLHCLYGNSNHSKHKMGNNNAGNGL